VKVYSEEYDINSPLGYVTIDAHTCDFV